MNTDDALAQILAEGVGGDIGLDGGQHFREIDSASNTIVGPRHHLTTPQQMTTIAKQLLWLCENEQHSPHILPFPSHLLQQLQESVREKQRLIDAITAGGTATDYTHNTSESTATLQMRRKMVTDMCKLPFSIGHLFKLEITRLNYLVVDLLRIRLKKIQAHAVAINYYLAQKRGDESGIVEYVFPHHPFHKNLSENEKKVAIRLAAMMEEACRAGGLNILPRHLRSLGPNGEELDEIPEQVLGVGRAGLCSKSNSYVFVTALEPVTVTLPDVESGKELHPGDVWICRYRHIEEHILSAKLRLV